MWCKNFDFWVVDLGRCVAWCSGKCESWGDCFLSWTNKSTRTKDYSRKSSGFFVLKFFGVFDNLGAPRLLRWSPEISTDALRHNNRKPENSVRTVTSCFFFFRCWCRPRVSTSNNSSEQAKDFERTEKISSVFMLVVLIDEENVSLFFSMEWDAFSIFVGGLIFHRSLDFSGRVSLHVFERTIRIHTKTICSETKWCCEDVVFLKVC